MNPTVFNVNFLSFYLTKYQKKGQFWSPSFKQADFEAYFIIQIGVHIQVYQWSSFCFNGFPFKVVTKLKVAVTRDAERKISSNKSRIIAIVIVKISLECQISSYNLNNIIQHIWPSMSQFQYLVAVTNYS